VPTPLDFGGRPHSGGHKHKSSSDSASSENPGTSRYFLRDNQETSEMSERRQGTDQEGKPRGHTASMRVSEESDHMIIPMNLSNKAARRQRRGWREARGARNRPTARHGELKMSDSPASCS
jgi:hypothetical protein